MHRVREKHRCFQIASALVWSWKVTGSPVDLEKELYTVPH